MPYADPPNYELPFQSGSDTSRDAALKARDFIGKQGRDVLAWFTVRALNGGTQMEASAALGIARASICARVHALEKVGKLRKTDERRQGCAVYVSV
jgi:hypothetical protein